MVGRGVPQGIDVRACSSRPKSTLSPIDKGMKHKRQRSFVVGATSLHPPLLRYFRGVCEVESLGERVSNPR